MIGPLLLVVLLLGGCSPLPAAAPVAVRPGIERFAADPPAALRGRRVGLITNHTGRTSTGESSIDLLDRSPHLELVALFSPEHGIRGTAADGVRIDSSRDEKSGLPVHSLYGETRRPTPAMLQGVEALVFDIQDIGARQYTYISTMALAMDAAREAGIPFVVLDRPNPIGGEIVEGNLLDPAFATFVGMYPVTGRHGMTAGELARLFHGAFGVGAEPIIVPAEGWRRDQWYDDTGLPWVNPSPNMRSLTAATHYPGTVLFEGTNLSEGRGSDTPFEHVGAPWLDADAIAREMNAMSLPGVRYEATRFTIDPSAAKHPGRTVPAVRLVLTDRQRYRPFRAAALLIDAIHRRHPTDFAWTGSIDRLAGTDRFRLAVEARTLPALLDEWEADAQRFHATREPYLLYR